MKSRTRQVIVLVLVLLTLTSMVVPPVVAQSSTTTTEPTTNGTTTNNSSSGGDGGGGGKVCFFGKCIPEFHPIKTITDNLGDIMDGIFGWFGDKIDAARNEIAKKLVNLINKIPAPGDYDDPLSWNPGLNGNDGAGSDPGVVSSTPENDRWVSVYQVWFYTIILSMAIFLISGTWLFTAADPYQFRQMGKTWGIGIVMAILTWFVAPLVLHATRALSSGLAPDAADLTSNMSLELGLFVGLLTSIFAFGAFLAAFVALAIQYFLAFFLVAFWPLAWALRTTRNNMLESIGDSGIYMFGLLQVLYVMQALILQFAFQIQGISPNIGDTLFAYIASLMGIYLALVKLPPALLRRAMSAGVIGLGGSTILRRRRRLSNPAISGGRRLNRWRKNRGDDDDDEDGGDGEPESRGGRDSTANPNDGSRRNHDINPSDMVTDGDGRDNRTSGGGPTAADGGNPKKEGFSASERKQARYGSDSMSDDNSEQQSNYDSNRNKGGGIARRKRGGVRRGRSVRERRKRGGKSGSSILGGDGGDSGDTPATDGGDADTGDNE